MKPQEILGTRSVRDVETKFVKCPQCSAILSADASEHPWCDQCGWGVELPLEEETKTLFERFHFWLSRRWGDRFHQQMLETPPGTQEFPAALWIALLLALVPNGLTLLFLIAGVQSVFHGPSRFLMTNVFLGLLCFLFAWLLLPQISRLKRSKRLARNEFPALYHLADRIAAEMGIQSIDEIHVNLEFNAYASQIGLQQKRVLVLGLPLLVLLNGKELVALMGNELAHFKSHHYAFSLFIETAIASLDTWYTLFDPARLCEPERMEAYTPSARIFLWLFSLICLPISGLLFGWMYLLVMCYWRIEQQAEYLADSRAAQLSGTQAMLSLFRRLTQHEIYEKELSFSYLSQDGQNFLSHLRKRFDQVTLREEMRVLWVEKLTHTGVDHTHPPTLDRIEYLKKYYCSTAKVGLSPWDETQIQKECLSVFEPLLQQVFQLDQITFRELFVSKGW